MTAKKTKTLIFYSYEWNNGFRTFFLASTPAEAIKKLNDNKEKDLPPEVRQEEIVKNKLSKAGEDFIITIGPNDEGEDEDGFDSFEASLN